MGVAVKNEHKIKSKFDVQTYIDRLSYALNQSTCEIKFIKDRNSDKSRNKRYANRYTINSLFPDEDSVEALKRELLSLTVENYMHTLKDLTYSDRSDLWVFAKKYNDYVYIKIRVELVSRLANGNNYVFVLSFHYSDQLIEDSDFPYLKR